MILRTVLSFILEVIRGDIMIKDYPNLELLDYKVQQLLKVFDLIHDKYDYIMAEMYPQLWGSTALGFGGIGGQAMTIAYTTVFYDQGRHYAMVFFDSRLAYIVSEPTEAFWADLKEHKLLSVDKAKVEYGAVDEL